MSTIGKLTDITVLHPKTREGFDVFVFSGFGYKMNAWFMDKEACFPFNAVSEDKCLYAIWATCGPAVEGGGRFLIYTPPFSVTENEMDVYLEKAENLKRFLDEIIAVPFDDFDWLISNT